MDAVTLGKHLVERGDLQGLQHAFKELEVDVGNVDMGWLFQKVYLHACLKGQGDIAEWLEKTVFPTLDPITQIALRQGFAYGRHLLATAERRSHTS